MKKKIRNKNLYVVKLVRYNKSNRPKDVFMQASLAYILGINVSQVINDTVKSNKSLSKPECKTIFARKHGDVYKDIFTGEKYNEFEYNENKPYWKIISKESYWGVGRYIDKEILVDWLEKLNTKVSV